MKTFTEFNIGLDTKFDTEYKEELMELSLTKAAISILSFKFIKLLKKPFKEWTAFELGLIDEKGVKIKNPKTKEEKDSLSGIKNLSRKIKRLLGKFIPNEKLLYFLVTVYLLKEDISNPTNKQLSDELVNSLSSDENELIRKLIIQ